MSEYRFRANGLNHDENLRCKTTLGTQTEIDLSTNHPDTSIQSNMIGDSAIETSGFKQINGEMNKIGTTPSDNPDVDRNNHHRQRRRYGGPTKRSRPIKIDNKSSTWCRGMTMRSIFQLSK